MAQFGEEAARFTQADDESLPENVATSGGRNSGNEASTDKLIGVKRLASHARDEQELPIGDPRPAP